MTIPKLSRFLVAILVLASWMTHAFQVVVQPSKVLGHVSTVDFTRRQQQHARAARMEEKPPHHSSSSSSLNMIMLAEAAAAGAADSSSLAFLQNRDVWVFVAGVFPFAWATVEFWRRIAFGEPFGTGSDAIVIIGMDDSPTDSRGRKVLGKGALVTAYILFAIAFGTLGIVLYSVISSDAPPDILPLPSSSQ
jgi:hypothetical protein